MDYNKIKMKTLREIITEAEKSKVAVGHFNVSELLALKAIFNSARELNLPVIIGVSEGEREFFGTRQIAAAVKSLREEFNYPIFLNADHTHSFEKIKEAVEAGFDAVLFDAGKLPLEENIKQTKEVVEWARKASPNVLIEAELGYIGSGSVILESVPEGAAIEEKDMTNPEDAARFVKETGVDLIGPSVGNIHGMFKNSPNPHLNIEKIKAIREAAGVPLVLHGGSGIRDEEFTQAIDAGISIIHINTELRSAFRKGLEESLGVNPSEIAPYKLLNPAIAEMEKIVANRLKLFNKLV